MLMFLQLSPPQPISLVLQACLQAHLTLVCRLVRERRFSDAEKMIKLSWLVEIPVVLDRLCWSGEVKRGWELVEEMIGRGIKPNVVTFNAMVNACAKRWNFEELELVLLLMEKEGVAFSDHMYKVLIDGFTSSGKIDEAKMLFLEMHDKGLKVAAHLYNLVINGNSRLGLMDGAKSMYGE
nr:pentatricopeptide repeat-containing protein [Quercus suber]